MNAPSEPRESLASLSVWREDDGRTLVLRCVICGREDVVPLLMLARAVVAERLLTALDDHARCRVSA